MSVEYTQGDDLPVASITWRDDPGPDGGPGAVIDLTDYTFTLKVGTPGRSAQFTKTTGITGAATAPNVLINWSTTGELNTLAAGSHVGQLLATRTADGKRRSMEFPIKVKAAIA